VLLDQGHTPGRVVFLWEAWDQPADAGVSPATRKTGLVKPVKCCPSRVDLNGSEGALGVALIRATPDSGPKPPRSKLLEKPAQQLAHRLDKILMQRRRERAAQKGFAFDRIGELIASGAPTEQVFQAFAHEIENLVDYQRLMVFVTDQQADLLTCVFRVDEDGGTEEPNITRQLSGTGCEPVVTQCEARVVDELRATEAPRWPELPGGEAFRSAVVVPVRYAGNAIGTVALESRLPKAYGVADKTTLSRIAALLGPLMRDLTLDGRLVHRDKETIVFSEIVRILACCQSLEDVFDRFSAAALQLADFDFVTLAWLDSNGLDIHTLRAFPDQASVGGSPPEGPATFIQTRLRFAGTSIGTLTLWRRRGPEFGPRDLEVLDLLGIQVSAAVQYDRLRRLARRQAINLGQMRRAAQPWEPAPSSVDSQQLMVDQAARMLRASFAGLYLEADGEVVLVAESGTGPGQDALPDPLAPKLVALVKDCLRTGRQREIAAPPARASLPTAGVNPTASTAGYLAAPVRRSSGPMGVLVSGRDGSFPWSTSELDLLKALADEIAGLISASGPRPVPPKREAQRWQDSLGRELLVDAAHTLRTHLSSIKGYSSTLLQPDIAWPPELHQEFLETIDRETDQMNRAIAELLDSTGSGPDSVRLHPSVNAVQSLLQLAEAELIVQGWQRAVRFQCAPGLPTVIVDQARMVAILVYLVQCADRSAAPGASLLVRASMFGGRPRVTVGSAGEGLAGIGETAPADFQPVPPGESPASWLDEELMLSVSVNLLTTQGVELHVGPSGPPEEMFWFELPMQDSTSDH